MMTLLHFTRFTYAAAFGLALMACLALGTYAERAKDALDLRDELAAAYNSVVKLERDQRAFIITRSPEYLEDYNEARTNVLTVMATLADRVGRDADDPSDLDLFATLVDARISQMEITMEAAIAGRDEKVADLIEQHDDRELMVAMFDVSQRMVANEQERLEQFWSKLVAKLPLLAGSIAFLGFFGLIWLSIRSGELESIERRTAVDFTGP